MNGLINGVPHVNGLIVVNGLEMNGLEMNGLEMNGLTVVNGLIVVNGLMMLLVNGVPMESGVPKPRLPDITHLLPCFQ